MVIAFDFDGVLSNYKIQYFAKKCLKKGIEIWVLTARRSGEHNKDLHDILNKLGLPLSNTVFTNGKDKIDILKGINADLIIEDNISEFESIKNYTDTIPLLFK